MSIEINVPDRYKNNNNEIKKKKVFKIMVNAIGETDKNIRNVNKSDSFLKTRPCKTT
jgi:hypothetical protein